MKKRIKKSNIRKKTGKSVMKEILEKIKNKYIVKNKKERKKTFFKKTPIIDKEWISKFGKLIFEGPKYLLPLTEGTEFFIFSTFANAPEKLLQIALSFNSFSTVE